MRSQQAIGDRCITGRVPPFVPGKFAGGSGTATCSEPPGWGSSAKCSTFHLKPYGANELSAMQEGLMLGSNAARCGGVRRGKVPGAVGKGEPGPKGKGPRMIHYPSPSPLPEGEGVSSGIFKKRD
jgi:hypothetical protein